MAPKYSTQYILLDSIKLQGTFGLRFSTSIKNLAEGVECRAQGTKPMEWSGVRKNTANYFGDTKLVRGMGPDDVLELSTDSKALYVGPIDWTWGSTDQEIAVKLKGVATIYDTRCNQVEILMQEAGQLIERALSDVLKYDDLNVERFKIMMEFVEFDRTQNQQSIEQADNVYWNGLINEADLSAQGRAHMSDNSASISQQYDLTIEHYGEAAADAGRSGDDGDVARQNASAGITSTTAAKLQYQAQLLANASDSASHSARRDYEARARLHQIERQAITQEMVGIKLNEVQRPGGALNYNERMEAVGDRAFNDFLEVYARLNAIASGLSEFYSITDPSAADLDTELNTARTRVEGAVSWLRKAANALARAKMDEQSCVIRLTILPQGKDTLLDELKKGRVVQFPADLIADMARAHLMGISATAESLTGDSWVDLEITSPEQTLSEITLPSVKARLGRVSSSASLNIRDIAGGRSILNRSPVGNWTLLSSRDDRGKVLSRLHLDFQIAFCPS